LLVAGLAGNPASAKADDLLKPAVAVGFSYPLVFSVSAGAMLPLGAQEKDYDIATTVALRLDGEVGLGGGSVGAGLFVPVRYFAFSVKAVRMRTWLLTWNEEKNRTFDGGVIEFALPSLHGGPKVGLGSFRDREPLNGTRGTFTYVFLGVGW
jgi:hypothetical protein